MRSSAEERFFNLITKDESGCWLWKGFRYRNGYGEFYYKGKKLAHRAAYMMFKGEIPKGMFVLHKCDVRNCVNVEHLWLGTAKDNSQDMAKKERSALGDKNGSRKCPERLPTGDDHVNSKLTCSKVKVLWKMWNGGGVSQSGLARKFGVSKATIRQVLTGMTWRHVEIDGPKQSIHRERHNQILSDDDVREIRSLWGTQKMTRTEIAEKFGVQTGLVARIISGDRRSSVQ